MKVRRIDLGDDEMPERVLVELTHDEAALVASVLGSTPSRALDEVLPRGGALAADVWNGLAAGVFNRYYEDGVATAVTAIRERP